MRIHESIKDVVFRIEEKASNAENKQSTFTLERMSFS